jgi:signal transduction histidine kinase
MLADRGIETTLELPANLPPVAHDADQMQQVLINLIKNAAEASERGGRIVVNAAMAPARRPDGSGPAIVVSVTDQGCGIDADTQKTLFEPFFTTKTGGTGLGLYITHDIVKRHGGGLTVSSLPGQGATFMVELPLEHQGGLV